METNLSPVRVQIKSSAWSWWRGRVEGRWRDSGIRTPGLTKGPFNGTLGKPVDGRLPSPADLEGEMMKPQFRVLDHPLAKHCLAQLRNEVTPPAQFRSVTRQLSTLLAIEATRDLRTAPVRINTPMESTLVEVLDDKLVVVPILRAGLGMLEAVVQLFPDVLVGYLGLERDELTAKASVYYSKLPVVRDRTVLLVDPMLATGGSSCHALSDIYSYSPARVILVCIVAAPEGVAAVAERFPGAEIVTASLDRELNSRKYILPGLGDFGDRLYGTL